jgi:hypothetical protein
MFDKTIMSVENVLPENFDGTFRFTNWTDEDFVGVWGKKEYHFPANSTSPMIMTDYSPIEVQQIRKKFALDLAQKVFGTTEAYAKLMKQERNDDGTPRLNSIHGAGTYSLDALAPYIQRCLTDLPPSKVTVAERKETSMEDKLSKDDEGRSVTEAVDKKISLRKKALEN